MNDDLYPDGFHNAFVKIVEIIRPVSQRQKERIILALVVLFGLEQKELDRFLNAELGSKK